MYSRFMYVYVYAACGRLRARVREREKEGNSMKFPPFLPHTLRHAAAHRSFFCAQH